jgi:hypothetical protein
MIRLVTVIGHGVNLLPHFIYHYENYVDEINIVVYESEKYPSLGDEVKKIVDNHSNVNIVKIHQDRIFDWEKVTMLYNYITNKHPNDWWVIADIDEFHLYPHNNLRQMINNCDEFGWEVVRGGFVDRIGEEGEFVELNQTDSIWFQYPHAGFFRYPMSKANPNKICVMKGHIELTSGQHYAKIDGHTTWKWQGWDHPLINPHSTVQVHHFKWDKTSIDRIREVAELRQSYAYSDEYKLMFEELRRTKFKIDLTKNNYMFELFLKMPDYNIYQNWNKLIKKIKSI